MGSPDRRILFTVCTVRERDAMKNKEAEKPPFSSRRFEEFFQNSPDLLGIADLEGRFLEVGKAWKSFAGKAALPLPGRCMLDFVHPEDVADFVSALSGLARGEKAGGFTVRCLRADGSPRHVEWHLRRSGDLVFSTARDVTDSRDAGMALLASESNLRFLTETLTDVLWVHNLATNRFTYFSPSILQLRGYTPEEAMEQTFEESLSPQSKDQVLDDIARRMEEFRRDPDNSIGEAFVAQQKCRNGRLVWVENATRYRYNAQHEIEVVGVSRSIEERKRAERDILYAASHDLLTGLHNRAYLDERLAEEVRRSDRYGEPLAMALFDIDHFRTVNDTWGHAVGDELLRLLGKSVEDILRSTDILARVGGDEFIVVLPETAVPGARAAAEKMRAVVESTSHPKAHHVTASFGVAGRVKNESFTSWFRRLDEALRTAKGSGRNQVNCHEDGPGSIPASVQIEWRPEWDCGNELIDGQHRELSVLGNELIRELAAGKADRPTIALMTRLIDHTTRHFRDEERILSSLGESDPRHSQIHADLLSRARRLRDAFRSGRPIAAEFASLLVDDLVMGHLLEENSRFFPDMWRKSGQLPKRSQGDHTEHPLPQDSETI
jgi:diguanylate cyclase (GGDEF)-like protein/hemerythrin-like metal-binding protein/PAS domain S-box-containing protein